MSKLSPDAQKIVNTNPAITAVNPRIPANTTLETFAALNGMSKEQAQGALRDLAVRY